MRATGSLLLCTPAWFNNRTRRLTERIEVNHDTRIFRFALPSPEHILGLPGALRCVALCVTLVVSIPKLL
jgi:hypothetical protein